MKLESPKVLSSKTMSNNYLVATVNSGHGSFNDIESDHECVVDSYQLNEKYSFKEQDGGFGVKIKKLQMVHVLSIFATLFLVMVIVMKETDVVQKHSQETDITDAVTADNPTPSPTSYQSPTLSPFVGDDLIDEDQSVPGGIRMANLLFDFSTLEGELELTSVYYNQKYKSDVAALNEKTAYWRAQFGTPEIPDTSGTNKAWNTVGGVSPWLDDSSRRDITQKYSHPTAPNIVLFLVDDWGYNDIGYRSTYMNWTTPNIDKLANNGIKLSNYYTHELCGPSRAALLTGRYATRFGMHGSDKDIVEVPSAEVFLSEELKSAGYRTYMVGKWHLGWSALAKTPTYRGFDYFYGYLGGFIDYWTKKYGTHQDLTENTKLVTNKEELSETMHSAYLYQMKAEAVIADHAANYSTQPMFLYYASQLIHTKWAAPQTFLDRCTSYVASSIQMHTTGTDEMTYCAMNLMLDEVVGNLTCALERNNLTNNTIFILVSDNGGYVAMNGNNYPYREAKGSLFRGGDSVPGLVYAPSGILPEGMRGSSYDGEMHVTDWLPTLMNLATGGAWTGSYTGATMDGNDMWHALSTGEIHSTREMVHYVDARGNVSYQLGGMKLIQHQSDTGPYAVPDQVFLGVKKNSEVCEFFPGV